MCQDESDSPRLYEDRSPRSTKQQTNKTAPRGRFFHAHPTLVLELLGTIDVEAFYILVYNSSWLAPVGPRRAIVLLTGKLLGVVRIESHGSNMGFVGESGVCSFSENWRRHGTI